MHRKRLSGGAAFIILVFGACGGDGPLTVGNNADPADPGTVSGRARSIAVVSGDGQVGKAGDYLEHPFVVRVTDGHGSPLRYETVKWERRTGDGDIHGSVVGGPYWVAYTLTDYLGETEVLFGPRQVGDSTVAATVVAAPDADVVFTANANVLVVRTYWGYAEWRGPDFNPDVVVPAGTPVEWDNEVDFDADLRIASISAPPGGSPFDSGTFFQSGAGRFRFVPQVAGTWEYAIGHFVDPVTDTGYVERHRLTAK
jgi:hypothetical protein